MSLSKDQGMSTDLSEREQDATISETFPTRPGAKDIPSAGTAHTDTLSDSVMSSLDSVADRPAGTQSVTEQLQRGTQSVTEHLPTAQRAADSLKNGVTSLVSGISKLAVGATGAAQEATVHTGSDKSRDVDDLAKHIPGAFDSETTDAEDIHALKSSLPSREQVRSQLPKMEAATAALTGSERPPTDQARDAARSVAGSVMPNTQHSQGDPSINSVGVNSTTNDLAGQIPLERNDMPQRVVDSQMQAGSAAPLDQPAYDSAGVDGVPDVVTDSQRRAGEAPEAAANPQAVQEKMQMEQELKREVSTDLPSNSNATAERAASGASYAAGAAAGGLAVAGSAAAEVSHAASDKAVNGASYAADAATDGMAATRSAIGDAAGFLRQKTAETTGTDPVSVLPESAQTQIDPEMTTQKSSSIPEIVSESQRAAGVGPEAAGNPVAVHEKSQMERELQSEISPVQATSTNSSITGAMSGGLASVGAAATGAAAYAREKTHDVTGTDPVSVLPESAQHQINPSVSENSRPAADSTDASGMSSGIHNGAVDAAAYAREKTHKLTGTDPVSILPESAQHQINTSVSEHSRPAADSTDAGGMSSGIHNGAVGAAAYAREKTHKLTGTDPVSVLPESAQRQIESTGSEDSRPATDLGGTGCLSSGIHNGVVGAGSSCSQDVDLNSGIKNGVIGAGSGEPSDAPEYGMSGLGARQTAAQAISAPVEHISVGGVDLSAGVRNTVTGAGGRHD